MTQDRYQNYVIRDGQFIGEFERMYQRFDDPWCQSDDEHSRFALSRNAAAIFLRKSGVRSVVEFGAGLGHTTEMIRRSTGCRVLGVDISETAVAKARASFPDCGFAQDTASNVSAYADYDAVFFAEITWYILPELTQIFGQMLDVFAGKTFIHNLTFYGEGVQKYGRDYFTSFDEFTAFCPFRLIEWMTSGKPDLAGTTETSALFRIEPK